MYILINLQGILSFNELVSYYRVNLVQKKILTLLKSSIESVGFSVVSIHNDIAKRPFTPVSRVLTTQAETMESLSARAHGSQLRVPHPHDMFTASSLSQ